MHAQRPCRHTSWMADLPDNLLISEINIPGSHNAAAINTVRPTRWACQDRSITEQLAGGIRLLDIRLKPKKHRNGYIFTTCHGRLGFFGSNEFQPFGELLDECIAFLTANPNETIVMTLKIDDWRRTRDADYNTMLQNLQALLTRAPILKTAHLPTLGECRGKIYLINRINDDPALGVSLNIPDNTPGTMLPPTTHRHYMAYIQDQYKGLDHRDPEAHKLRLTMAAIENKRPGVVLLNFASATKPFGRLLHIIPPVTRQPKALGWLFLDYALTPCTTSRLTVGDDGETLVTHRTAFDLPSLIIASNY